MLKDMKVYSYNTIIVGTGCAGFNAADWLYNLGQTDIAIVTEGINMGTSRNTGSDKQTYYKLGMAGSGEDSVEKMAQTLFAGGSMNGDNALIEAAGSALCFGKLVSIGVNFPYNEFGEFVGYKTDHDNSLRATSCGPLTSKFMTEALQRQVIAKKIPIFDGYRVIEIIKEKDKAIGLITIDDNNNLVLFNCTNIIYAVGGPSGIYSASVYPQSQTCGHGCALLAGVKGANLTEWQYGIASTEFRWNLSGSYQQVIPSYYSTDKEGNDKKYFLKDYLNTEQMLEAVFLKGYQWPFDPKKIEGSSIIDIAVYIETQIKNRLVYMDFTKNDDFDNTLLTQEALKYLQNSDALDETPIKRLRKLNEKAYKLYLDNGIDLEKSPLLIDVCAQHNNGGLDINIWGETSINHFFACGEAAGVFGVYRPGGSALNSTQVTSMRCAQFIAKNYKDAPISKEQFADTAQGQVQKIKNIVAQIDNTQENVLLLRNKYQQRMSKYAAVVRNIEGISKAIKEVREDIENFTIQTKTSCLAQAFINRDILYTQLTYLSAMKYYIASGGVSRGSYLIGDIENPIIGEDIFREKIILSSLKENEVNNQEVLVRPMQKDRELWFEKVYGKEN